ncbi:DinB family protein [Foetidibacter luteolus]|uniref:DinB family protein n=1 Tax=Foetidibacter luteolus TaxID=2608880 RepID=UPI00129A3B9C|nr:DinB family protein [Foetidibacter luteolus]
MPSSFLADTFAINNRVNIYLLNAIDESHLADVLNGKGRNVGEQFAHLHNVRLMWLQAAQGPLAENLTKLEKGAITKAMLLTALEQSGKAIEELLAAAAETNKIKGFKPHATGFLGYLISHEAHHRGQVMLILKHNNHMTDKKTQFGIWEWGVR